MMTAFGKTIRKVRGHIRRPIRRLAQAPFAAARAKALSDLLDRINQSQVHVRIIDREKLTTYSSIEGGNPWFLEFAATAPPVLQKQRSLHLLDSTWHNWHGELTQLIKPIKQAKRLNPQARFVVITHTPFCSYQLSRAGVQNIYIQSSALEDEHSWVLSPPDPDLPRFDAIYNARLVDWKNHALARELESLLLVYDHPVSEEETLADFRRQLPDACFANHDFAGGHYKNFGVQELSRFYGQAKVSLALSQQEGYMRASFQSLLTGTPIVSIPNIGGRNKFYHEDTALIVEPTAEAVAQGVREMISRNLDPHFVRREALKLLQIERREFMETVNALRRVVFGRNVPEVDFEAFRGSKFAKVRVADFLAELSGCS